MTKSLISPNSLDGWKSINGGNWSIVEEGTIYGEKVADIPVHCLLVSEKEYDDFICIVEYKAIHGDSGFYFRLQPEKNAVGYKGYHAEIRSDGKNAGGLFDVGVGWLAKPDPQLAGAAFKPDDWNTMVITAVGAEISVSLNGYETSRIIGTRSHRGCFGIQLHANEATKVSIRKITVKEI